MAKVILEVRANEYASRAANPHVPWSADELAADAAACREAGAALYHFHARDPKTGAPAHAVADYGDAIRAIRGACDMLITPTLGAYTIDDAAERVAHIPVLAKDPETRPDFAPVDLASSNIDPYRPGRGFGAEDLVYRNSIAGIRTEIAAIRGCGVAVLPVLWNVGSARVLGALFEMGELEGPLLVEIVLSDSILAVHPATEAGLDALLPFLPDRAERWIALSAGGNLLAMVEAVVARGGHLSFGLGDHPFRELGTPTNAELVAAVARRVEAAGGVLATPDDVRAELSLERGGGFA